MRPFVKEPEELRQWADEVLPRLRYEGPFKKDIDIAQYYGFSLLRPLRIESTDRVSIGETDLPHERVALMRMYLERGLDACIQPIQVVYTQKIPYQKKLHLKLDILGSERSIAEVVALHTACAILRERGHENLSIGINSVGGPSSQDLFTKAVVEYYRKQLDKLDETCRECFKTDCFEPMRCNHEACVEVRKDAPEAVAFLTENSRRHLSEILECLETLSMPYRIENSLVGCRHYTTHIIFEIRKDDDAGEVLARGERYDLLARKAGVGRNIPAVGVDIEPGTKNTSERFSEFKRKRVQIPKVFLIHLGMNANRGVLPIIEILRRAKVTLGTAIMEDTLGQQMRYARELETPFITIVGQKEILEGTAIVRNRETRSQEIIPQEKLVSYLRRF